MNRHHVLIFLCIWLLFISLSESGSEESGSKHSERKDSEGPSKSNDVEAEFRRRKWYHKAGTKIKKCVTFDGCFEGRHAEDGSENETRSEE